VPTPRQKVDGLEDAVHIVRRLWTEPAASYAGPMHRIESADIEPKPAHRIPIWLGTFGQRALALTGRVADGWIPTLGPAPADRLPAMRERVLTAASDAGRDRADITCALNLRIRLGGDTDADMAAGPPAAVTHRLKDFIAMGFTSFNLQPTDRSQLEQIAAEVLPALRQE
jgi:alkanesulfonate monooxygenase SsuD/methylene tetrahydromethanopterin reductase-like flavin-dependent oxidoreductase (luciferase family)